MTAFSSNAFSTNAFSSNAFSLDSAGSQAGVPDSSFQVDQILNANAVEHLSNFEICPRTGFRQLPIWHPDSKFVRDGYRDYVRLASRDSVHPQDYVASRGNDRQEGPQNSEASSDSFIQDGGFSFGFSVGFDK